MKPRPEGLSTGTKKCRDCLEDKPKTDFHLYNYNADGLGYRCKPCAKAFRLAAPRVPTPISKICTVCSLNKSAEAFNVRKASRDGLSPKCKDCSKITKSGTPESRAGIKHIWSNKNRKRVSENNRQDLLRRKYNLTVDDFNSMFESQGRRCKSCHRTDPGGRGQWHVDHDHITGLIRGILCNNCNTGIGFLGDTLEGLEMAIRYLTNTYEPGIGSALLF